MKTLNSELFGRVLSRGTENVGIKESSGSVSRSELRVLFSDVFADEDWRDGIAKPKTSATDKAA